MNEDRARWEARYGDGAETAMRPPSAWLVAHRADLPPGRALDLACGDGRHALWLAAQGYRVDAIDRAHAALVRLLGAARQQQLTLQAVQADLEAWPLPVARYDVIVNVRYLQRDLCDPIIRALRPGGVVVFETFLRDQAQLGHPRNPAFLLERGELAARFDRLEQLAYEEAYVETESGPAYLARLIGRKAALGDRLD